MTRIRSVRQDALADLADVPATSRRVRRGDIALRSLRTGERATGDRPAGAGRHT